MARQFAVIAIDKIDVGDNVRTELTNIPELAASIKEVGLIEPVVVRPGDETGQYVLIAGARRLAALKRNKESEAPARIFPKGKAGDREATTITLQLVENLQRLDLSVVEEAAAYSKLKDLGWKQKDIARAVGRSEAVISKRLALLDLPDRAIDLFDGGQIGSESLYAMTKVGAAGADLDPILSQLEDSDVEDTDFRAEEVEAMVNQATARANADRELSERKTEYEERGVKVIDATYDQHGYPMYPKDRLGWGIDIDHDAHLAEPCAAIHLYVQHGHVGESQHCTDKRRHTPEGASDLKIPDLFKPNPQAKAEAKSRQRGKDLVALASKVLDGRPPARERIIARAAELYIESVWAEVQKRAAKWLDLESEADADDRGLLGIYRDAGPSDRFRILLAVVLAHGHSRTTGSYVNIEGSASAEALNFLAECGHPYQERESK